MQLKEVILDVVNKVYENEQGVVSFPSPFSPPPPPFPPFSALREKSSFYVVFLLHVQQ